MKLFQQAGPRLDNQYQADPYLSGLAQTHFPDQQSVLSQLEQMGELAGGELYQLQQADRLNEPVLTQWDAWGERIDQIEVTPLWKRAEVLAAEQGLIAIPYEQKQGALSRMHQFLLVYLFMPSTDLYACPLAMTDGAARILSQSGNQKLIDRALPHLLARDPQHFWTSGQWMTELPGGSDVGKTETQAHCQDGHWQLQGRKWFTSATTSQMALALARPEGNPAGGRGLALFYLETRDSEGRLKNIQINRLKDKLGTRKVPTAELLLTGTPAELVGEPHNGVRQIAAMLNITRTWNAISALALMRRGLNLAWDYARKRVAFGSALIDKPLHRETLLQLEAEFAGAFYLSFEMVHLLGLSETEGLSAQQEAYLRLLIPLVKLSTGKQAVSVLSEVLECFGGAGYIEDTGLPVLLRDAQVLPIWEGTTNVLSLDSLRALGPSQQAQQTLSYLLEQVPGGQAPALKQARQALGAAGLWLQASTDTDTLERGARRFAMTLARSLQLAALARQAQQTTLGDQLPLDLEDLMCRYAWTPLNQIQTT